MTSVENVCKHFLEKDEDPFPEVQLQFPGGITLMGILGGASTPPPPSIKYDLHVDKGLIDHEPK